MRLNDIALRNEMLSLRDRAGRSGLMLIIGALHVVLILWLATQSSKQQPRSDPAISGETVLRGLGAVVSAVCGSGVLHLSRVVPET